MRWKKMKYRNKLKLVVIFTGLFFIFIAGTGFAQEPNITEINNADYKTGTIDRIAANEIVIGDSLYKYAKSILFLSRQAAKIETRWFKKGDKVRFVINDKYEAVIVRKL